MCTTSISSVNANLFLALNFLQIAHVACPDFGVAAPARRAVASQIFTLVAEQVMHSVTLSACALFALGAFTSLAIFPLTRLLQFVACSRLARAPRFAPQLACLLGCLLSQRASLQHCCILWLFDHGRVALLAFCVGGRCLGCCSSSRAAAACLPLSLLVWHPLQPVARLPSHS